MEHHLMIQRPLNQLIDLCTMQPIIQWNQHIQWWDFFITSCCLDNTEISCIPHYSSLSPMTYWWVSALLGLAFNKTFWGINGKQLAHLLFYQPHSWATVPSHLNRNLLCFNSILTVLLAKLKSSNTFLALATGLACFHPIWIFSAPVTGKGLIFSIPCK